MLQVSEQKLGVVASTVDLLKRYEVIAAADLNKVTSRMLQDTRKGLRGQLEVRCVKNTLMRISMEKAEKAATVEFMKTVAGPNVFLFTNGNPFKLAMTLEKNKVKVFAKAGDKALTDLTISAGNSGLSPGPLIGKFGALGVKTRIESGNIWVVQDTVVARKGDVISADLADLLMRLGVRAAEMGLSIKAAYEHGVVIQGSDLLLDIPAYKDRLAQAYGTAFQVALKAAYVTPRTAPTLLSMAAQNATRVAVEAGYVTKETASELIARADAQARSLKARVEATKPAQ
jgi:large subunit ribosomal protein L10